MLRDIITVFGGNKNLRNHFVIGFSNCDEWNPNWKFDFNKKSKQWQDKLQSEFGFGKIIDKDYVVVDKNKVSDEKEKEKEKESKQDDKKHNDNHDEFKKQEMSISMYKLSNVQHSKRFNKKGIKRWSQYKQFEKLINDCVESRKDPLFSTDFLMMKRMKDAIDRIQKV